MRKLKLWFRQILALGTNDFIGDESSLWVTKVINQLSLAVFALNMVFGPLFYLATRDAGMLTASMAEALLVLSLLVLNYFGKRMAAKIGFYLILNAATFYFSVKLGPMGEAQLMIVFLFGLILFLFQSRGVRAICFCFTTLLLAAMEANFKLKLIHPAKTATPLATDLMRWTAYAVIIFLVTILFHIYARNATRLFRKLQQYTKDIESDLEKEQQLSEMKSAYISTASHEIKSLFTGVKMMVLFLSRNEELKEIRNMPAVVRELKAGSDNIELVIENVLANSKIEARVEERPIYELINIRVILGSLQDMARYAGAERNITIETRLSECVPDHIQGDRALIIQILTNLLNNAIKFSLRNGKVVVSVSRENEYWVFSVSDQGRGIPQENVQRIFEPFFSHKSLDNPRGIGLGLSIVKHLVGVLNGQVFVESEIGRGSTFTVALPVLEPTPLGQVSPLNYGESLIGDKLNLS